MASSRARSNDTLALTLRVLVVAALAVSAYAHFKLAKDYDHDAGGSIRQSTLFQIQGVLASLAALFLVINARVIGWLPAFSLAAGSLFAVLLYRYVQVGTLGPLPDMTDMTWTSRSNLKVISAIAEGVGTVGAAAGLLLVGTRR